MNTINVHQDEVEFTSDPSEVIYKDEVYIIFSQIDDELTIILKDQWDVEIDHLAEQIDNTDKFLEDLRRDQYETEIAIEDTFLPQDEREL